MNLDIGTFLPQFAIMLLLVFANGFFVAAEFALVSVRRTRIEELISQGNTTAQIVKRVIYDPDRFIAATQLGITMASLGLGWIAEPALAHFIEPLFRILPSTWVASTVHAVAAGSIAFALITFMHVVFGELAPKSVALGYPETTALLVARPTVLFEHIFRPAIWILNGTGNRFLKLVGLHRPAGHQQVHSVEELKLLVTASSDSGELTAHEKEMIHNVFEFGDRVVREVMTPRPEMVTVEEHTTIAEFLQTFREAIHARFPIYANSIDNISGFLGIKDVLRVMAENGAGALDQPVGPLARPALFVPESKRVGKLFSEMQAKNIQIAIVIDEFGGTAGMVTLEELTHQVVGPLGDELGQERPLVETIDEHTMQIDAQMRVQQVNEQLATGLPESEDYETIAGFILYALRHIPKEGEQFRMGSWRITVTRMDGPKIEKVLLTRL